MNKKTILIVSLAAVVLLAGGGYISYAMFDLFKDPKTIYFEAEYKSIKNLNAANLAKRYEKITDKYLTQPLHSSTEISEVTFELDQADADTEKVLEMVKDAKFRHELQIDEQKQLYYNKMKLLLEEKDLLTLELFADGEKLGFAVPEIYEKYAVIHFKDLKETEDEEFLRPLPDKMISYGDIANALRISVEEVKPILLDYGKFYYDSIAREQATINKNAVFTEQGVEIPSREITITFSEEEFKDFLLTLTEKLAEDEALLDLIYTRYENVVQLLDDAGYETAKISRETFAERVKNAYFDVKDSLRDLRLNDDVKLVVHIDRNDNILSRTLTMSFDSEDGVRNGLEVKSAHWTDEKAGAGGVFTFKNRTSEGNGGEISLSYNKQETGEENRGEFQFEFDIFADDQTTNALSFYADYRTKGAAEQKDGEYFFKFTVNDNGITEEISGSLTSTVTEQDNSRKSSFRIKVNLSELVDRKGLKSVSLNISTEEKYGQELKLPELTAANTVDLGHLSDAESAKLQEEIISGWQQFVNQHADLWPGQDLFQIEDNAQLSMTRPEMETGEVTEIAPGVLITRYTVNSADYSETISYPVISGLPDERIQEEINASFKDLSFPDQSEMGQDERKELGYQYESDFEIQHVEGKILNIVFHQYLGYADQIHGMPSKISYIVNMETGETYQLSDLFDPSTNYKEFASDLIREQDTEGILNSFEEFESIADDDSMYLEEDGVVIYFWPYQYTPYAMGFPEFRLSYDQLEGVIDKEGSLWKALGK